MNKKKYGIYAVYYNGNMYEHDSLQEARFTEFWRKNNIRDGREDIIDGWCIKCKGEFCGNEDNNCQIFKESLIDAVFQWKMECKHVPKNI